MQAAPVTAPKTEVVVPEAKPAAGRDAPTARTSDEALGRPVGASLPEKPSTPKSNGKAPIFFPNDREFGEAIKKVPQETRTRLSDMLRANFKYLEILEAEAKPQKAVEEEVLPEDEAVDLGLEEEE